MQYKNVILIHGVGGLSKETYFSHLKNFCEEQGLDVYMPSLPSYHEGATFEEWKRYFDDNFYDKLDKTTLIFAQSMGTSFIVKYLAENKKEIGVYISAAAPKNILKLRKEAPDRAVNFAPTSSLFKPNDDEYETFKGLKFEKYSFFSDDDTFFDLENLQAYSQAIGSKAMFVKGKAHFNKEDKQEEIENFIYNIIK